MFVEDFAILTLNPANKSIVEKAGLTYTKQGDKIEIPIKFLSNYSNAIVKCRCDFCGNIFSDKYLNVTGELHSCGDKRCSNELRKHTCKDKYGCEHVKQCKDIVDKGIKTFNSHYGKDTNPEGYEELQNKIKKTMLERHGYEHALQNPELLKKAKNTNLERFGYESASKNPEVKKKLSNSKKKLHEEHGEEISQKRKQTCLERYGCEVVSQNVEVKKKMSQSINKTFKEHPEIFKQREQTMIEKYGVAYLVRDSKKCEEIKKLANVTMYKNGTGPISKNQEHICELVNGKLNYPLDKILLDIVIDNIVIEYDGGGHDLLVKIGKLTSSEFETKELKREKFIYNNGFKLIRIISSRDKLFGDDVMLNLIDICKNYLLTTNHHWIHINIDELKIKSKELILDLDICGNILRKDELYVFR